MAASLQVVCEEAAVVELLLQTGLRVSELCGLTPGDVHMAEGDQPGLLLVRQGKGKKDRVVPLNSVAARAVQQGGSGRLNLWHDGHSYTCGLASVPM